MKTSCLGYKHSAVCMVGGYLVLHQDDVPICVDNLIQAFQAIMSLLNGGFSLQVSQICLSTAAHRCYWDHT